MCNADKLLHHHVLFIGKRTDRVIGDNPRHAGLWLQNIWSGKITIISLGTMQSSQFAHIKHSQAMSQSVTAFVSLYIVCCGATSFSNLLLHPALSSILHKY